MRMGKDRRVQPRGSLVRSAGGQQEARDAARLQEAAEKLSRDGQVGALAVDEDVPAAKGAGGDGRDVKRGLA